MIVSFVLLALGIDFGLSSSMQLSDYEPLTPNETHSHGCGLLSHACRWNCLLYSIVISRQMQRTTLSWCCSSRIRLKFSTACDGGRLSIHWRFRGRSLHRTQRTCQTSCQCTLSVSPETVHTAGDYSCCVKKCDHFVCSSKTIAVQSRHGSNEPETTSVITGSFVIAQILSYLFPTCL